MQWGGRTIYSMNIHCMSQCMSGYSYYRSVYLTTVRAICWAVLLAVWRQSQVSSPPCTYQIIAAFVLSHNYCLVVCSSSCAALRSGVLTALVVLRQATRAMLEVVEKVLNEVPVKDGEKEYFYNDLCKRDPLGRCSSTG